MKTHCNSDVVWSKMESECYGQVWGRAAMGITEKAFRFKAALGSPFISVSHLASVPAPWLWSTQLSHHITALSAYVGHERHVLIYPKMPVRGKCQWEMNSNRKILVKIIMFARTDTFLMQDWSHQSISLSLSTSLSSLLCIQLILLIADLVTSAQLWAQRFL